MKVISAHELLIILCHYFHGLSYSEKLLSSFSTVSERAVGTTVQWKVA